MSTISGSVRLRPTRIGLLIRPTEHDRTALLRFVHLCTCLWGGRFNPIIPVARTLPPAWRRDVSGALTGCGLAEAYIRFFEPDVFVEAEDGLAKELGIQQENRNLFHKRIMPLTEFVEIRAHHRPDFAFGVNAFDIYRHRYDREFQFPSKQDRRFAVLSHGDRKHSLYDVALGVFPEEKSLAYVRRGYSDVFQPKVFEPTPSSLLEIHTEGYATPLQVGLFGIDSRYSGFLEPTIFVFDSSKVSDLIDYWNLRLFRQDVLPVDIAWAEPFAGAMREFITRNYRPLPGNPHGVMIKTTIEFGRSLPERSVRSIRELLGDVQNGSCAYKSWYDPIWSTNWRNGGVQPRRATLSVAEEDFESSASAERGGVQFRTLAPQFAEGFAPSDNAARWANVLTLRDYGGASEFAIDYPPNVGATGFPRLRLGEETLISREGIILLQGHARSREYIQLQSQTEAFVQWFESSGVAAKPSPAGRNAGQVIRSVGGLRTCSMFADEHTLKLLDKMAKTIHKTKDGTVEQYPDRTAGVLEWKEVIERRKGAKHAWTAPSLPEFTDRQVIRLGMAIPCSKCLHENWYDLSRLDYVVTCDQCLRSFEFPQGDLSYREKDWRFRVIGPFSHPDFAMGAYSTVLTLRVFGLLLHAGPESMTYSTGLDLSSKSWPRSLEIDFVAWYRPGEKFWVDPEPALVFGETKSFGTEVFHDDDIHRMKRLAMMYPGSYLVLSVLKSSIGASERARLRMLAEWGRVPLKNGQPRASVIVLTGIELFSEWQVQHTWKELGGRHASLTAHPSVHIDDLWTLADLTQQLYLEMPAHQSVMRRRIGAARL